MANVRAVAFDKTGTLTAGKPVVTDVVSCCELREEDQLTVDASVESRSEHPLAKAVVGEAETRGLPFSVAEEFEAIPGQGIAARVASKMVHLGSVLYLQKHNPMPKHLSETYVQLENQGKTIVGVVREGHCGGCGNRLIAGDQPDWMGLIAMSDELRPEAAGVVRLLQNKGIEVAMLTGDNQRVADGIAAQVGVTRVLAGLLPEDKVKAVKQLEQETGNVAMIGDGVNDAPALATATVGIAMGAAGTDVALETADVVLMGDALELIDKAITLSKKARRVVWQNIMISLSVIVALVATAVLVDLPLPLGVLGHEGSTVIVDLNGLIAPLIWPEIQRRRTVAKL